MESRDFAFLRRLATGAVLLAALAVAGGCTNLLFTAAYLIQGTDSPAECDKLTGKKVVVVCRPVVALQYRDARVDQDLAEAVSGLLQANVKKIKMVPHRKVAEWMDENRWEEYIDVGKALGADFVVGIDLEHFELRQSQTLFQGKANTEVKVVDCRTKERTNEVVFKKRMPQTVYPPNRVVQSSDVQEQQFRRDFVRVLADQVGRHFYPHDPHADVGLDSRNLE
jgi:hypothetical protein